MTRSGTNLEHARGYNRRLVLEIVRLQGPLGRTEIARRTGLSVQAIHNIVGDLVEAGLVRRRRAEAGGRGQPAAEILIDPAGAYTVGISFDHRRLVTVLVDLAGSQLGLEEHSLARPDPESVLGLIGGSVGRLVRGYPVQRIWGAGVVIPALIEQARPVSFGPSSLPEWDGFPLAETLGRRIGLPVYMENDATAAAVGEHLHGVGQRLRDFFYIYIGVGIGAGLIVGGEPYRGASGHAGEFGHLPVVPDGLPCQCGNRGCLERYVSLSAAQARLTGAPEGSEAVVPERLAEAFAAGDPTLDAWISDAAGHLRRAVTMVENLFDPERVVIGGILPEPILDALLARMRPLAPSVRGPRDDSAIRLSKAEVGLETPALGAAALPLHDGLTPSFRLIAQPTPSAPAVLRVS
ncbi:ROK family transcriptional regulator [Oceanibacterium hippocampi]|uniref:N-acetylglucosamine repressor n=1 Tax=Oceanibacterium hippocampi TaxID=745714 RepID=A0A1Y5TXG3_9PROT|nr:ROK family transcriptional regulator [Oceanibacterium hippocampi]SLN75824.1 N-acetylglucosamine repressor [Oceanibacterium hippocampi]